MSRAAPRARPTAAAPAREPAGSADHAPAPERELAAGPDPRPAPERELIMHLEPDQLVAETFRPVAPARLGARATLGLWALRAFVVLVSAMVIYTFVARLH